MPDLHAAPDLTWSLDLSALHNSRALPEDAVGMVCERIAARLECEAALWLAPADEPLTLLALQGRAGQLTADARAALEQPEALARLEAVWAGRQATWLDGRQAAGARLTVAGAHGGLLALREAERPFQEVELRWLGLIADYTSSSLSMTRLLSEERWQRQKAELMFQASKAIHTELHFDVAVREIALLTKQALKAAWVGALEWDAPASALRLVGSSAAPASDLRFTSEPLPLAAWPGLEAALGETSEAAGTSLFKIAAPAVLAEPYALGAAPLWLAPLRHKGQLQGALALAVRREAPALSSEGREVAAAMAELLALAMANQHLVDQEARARAQSIRAQAAMQERESLLRQIVHDLRNATQAMSLVVEDLDLVSDAAPEIKPSLRVLDSQVTFVSNFLKEKLLWLQAGSQDAKSDQAAMAQVLAEIERRFAPAARAKGQRLVVSAPEAAEVGVSTVTMIQILGNLVDNALKFTPPNGEVRLWAEYSDGWVTSYVADNGPGIPQLEQARIGEAGFRADPSHPDGVGLGLANVRQLVTRSGGLFGFASTPGHGTTFHVSLPAAQWGRTARERPNPVL